MFGLVFLFETLELLQSDLLIAEFIEMDEKLLSSRVEKRKQRVDRCVFLHSRSENTLWIGRSRLEFSTQEVHVCG